MQPPPRIPGYQLLARLGGGPMTAVYEAREAASGAACAVKVVRDDWDDQATAAKLLQREARAGLSVRHPHLVRVARAHVLQPPFFLVMDLLPGESLRRRLRRDYRLPLADALWVARQTAEALAALHQAGFLHGDVKPDNLRLSDAGSAVLIDLGFAHRPGENAAYLREGYVLGTANYLAPELCDALPAEEFASDLFSLGVTLFEVLTGRLPYPPGSLRQTFRRHRCDPPADIRKGAGTLPSALVALVERLLAHRPKERPSAAAVVQQLVKLEIAALRRGQGRRSA
jgi:serine/threonine protein kinase